MASLARQSQLTPSCLLHNQRYVTYRVGAWGWESFAWGLGEGVEIGPETSLLQWENLSRNSLCCQASKATVRQATLRQFAWLRESWSEPLRADRAPGLEFH
jgi:hypothetical protein